MKSKICTKCKVEKSVDEFTKDKRMINGLTNCCKNCNKLYLKKWKKYNMENFSDSYVSSKLKVINKKYYKYFVITPEMIEAKRAHLQLIREIKSKYA